MFVGSFLRRHCGASIFCCWCPPRRSCYNQVQAHRSPDGHVEYVSRLDISSRHSFIHLPRMSCKRLLRWSHTRRRVSCLIPSHLPWRFKHFLTVLCPHRLQTDFMCKTQCDCEYVTYSPVCASDGKTTFISACHAGCSNYTIGENGAKVCTA